jgi:hypothetical protein
MFSGKPGMDPMKRAIACAVVLLLASPAVAGSSRPWGKGGYIAEFQPVMDQYNASSELMRIEGHCQSLCTLFLGLRNVCVARGARLLFHAGHNRRMEINAGSTARMMNAYNGPLRRHLTAGGYMETLAFHTISGAMMIDRFGYKECPRG